MQKVVAETGLVESGSHGQDVAVEWRGGLGFMGLIGGELRMHRVGQVEGQRQHGSGRQFCMREVMTVPKSSASFTLSMDSSSPPIIGTIAFGESCTIDCG